AMRAAIGPVAVAAAFLCAGGAMRPASAQVPAGVVFEVDGPRPFERKLLPGVAFTPSGDFVVVWNRIKQYETSQGEVFAQRFRADGQHRGAELQVNTWTTDNQYANG